MNFKKYLTSYNFDLLPNTPSIISQAHKIGSHSVNLIFYILFKVHKHLWMASECKFIEMNKNQSLLLDRNINWSAYPPLCLYAGTVEE